MQDVHINIANNMADLVLLLQRIHTNCCILLYPPEASGGYLGLAFAKTPPRIEKFSALTLSEENYTS